jgi:acyl-CoA synthetase (AMP-forming)/AMP-acid ligase II/ubiquinone/menaquinone biosynthesis C-methylase UbiE
MRHETVVNRNKAWNLSHLLDRAAERYGDRTFIVGSMTLTYKEAALQTNTLAGWFHRKGVKRGDRVMIITGNRSDVALFVFAAARMGAIFTILNNSIKPYGLRRIIEQCEPMLVILDESTSALACEFDDAVIVWIGDGDYTAGGVKLSDILPAPGGGKQEFPGINSSQDPVCLIYTSGSTGLQRGVVISHDNIRFSTAAIQERLDYQTNDVVGLFLPLSFDYGLYQIFLCAAAGSSIFIGQPEFTALKLVSYLKMYNISVLPGVPGLFAVLLRLLAVRTQPLPGLRSVTNTGGHLPGSYMVQMRKYLPHVQIFPMYGLTECKRVSILLPCEIEAKPGSVGRPLGKTGASVVGEDGQPLPPGETGELVVRGRHLALGYWKALEETKQRFRQTTPGAPRELYTGDLCRMDNDGYIYFVGRKDHQFKHRGFRLNPLEIEETACNINGISAAGLVQIKEPEQLYLFISVNSSEVSGDHVKKLLGQRLEPYKIPEKVYILPELPRTSHGKLDRNQLVQLCPEVTAKMKKEKHKAAAAPRKNLRVPGKRSDGQKSSVHVNIVRFLSLLVVILLSPLLIINRIDFLLNIKKKKKPFYKSIIVKLIERYPLAYNISTYIWNFPLYSDIYRVLPGVSGKILQVGCGTGLLNRYYNKKGMNNLHMVNLDINIHLLKYGMKKKRFQSLVNASISRVPIKDNTFDVIIFARCFHHVRNHKGTFGECARLLKKNGIIIIADTVSLYSSEKTSSHLVNTALDGMIWIYSKTSFKKQIEANLPPQLTIRSIKYIRQTCINNYNLIYPQTDGLVIVEKRAG